MKDRLENPVDEEHQIHHGRFQTPFISFLYSVSTLEEHPPWSAGEGAELQDSPRTFTTGSDVQDHPSNREKSSGTNSISGEGPRAREVTYTEGRDPKARTRIISWEEIWWKWKSEEEV